jgi:PAS domain S-box-containing protein
MTEASRDINELKVKRAGQKKENLVTPNRSQLRIAADILESIEDLISAFDKNWNYVYLNEPTARLLGYTRQELLGKNFWKIFPKLVGTEFEKNFKEAMIKREIRRFEWETIYLNKGYHEFTVYPSVEGVTVYEVDINKRKALEQKLDEHTRNLEKLVDERTKKVRESEQSYRDLYESFGEAFIATNWELSVIHWNKAAEELTRIATSDALGKRIYDVLPEMLNVDSTPIYYALKQKKPIRFMMNTKSRQSGEPALFEVSTYPSAAGIIAIVEDKTVEEETKRLSVIGQTAGMVGHDIRNPLQAITSSLYLIKKDLEELPQSENQKDALLEAEATFSQITYIDKIVSDLQDYARPLKLELSTIDLKTFIANILSTLNIPENIETLISFETNLPKLRADAMLLRRILSNLATNGIQAMPEGGKLALRVNRVEPDCVTISVQDSGVGISEEVKPKLFMPLFTTKSKGQGFGLAVVKRLVEIQGGTINFESQISKGTTFIVKLPYEAA